MKKEISRGRTANVKRNICFSFIQVILSQFFPFIVRTLVIYRFGVVYLGLNSLFTSTLYVLSLTELGFGTAIVYSLYKPVALGNTEKICAYLAYYRKVYHIIGLIILAIGLLLLPFLDNLVKDQSLPGGLNLYVCYLIFLGDSIISYFLYGYMTAIPTAYQRRDIISLVELGVSFLKCIVQSLILLFSRCFYLYLLAIPAITVIRNLLMAYLVKKRYPGLKSMGVLSLEEKRSLRKNVRGIFINKITKGTRNSIDSVCISAFIGLTATGIYNNYLFVFSGVLGFSGIVCSSMMASVGNSIALESPDKNYSDMRRFDFMYMTIASWATVCMLCLYQPFILVWIGKEMTLNLSVVLGLCAYFYILKMGDIRWIYQEGAGLWFECRFIMIFEAIMNITLNIILCKLIGILGIVLSTVISVFITNFLLSPRILFKFYLRNKKLQEYWCDHAFYALTMAFTAGVSWALCEKILPVEMVGGKITESIFCLGGRLVLCTLLSVIVFWTVWHRDKKYIETVLWLKQALKA